MIDWVRVFTNSLWLLGLAFLLSSISYSDYLGWRQQLTFRAIWRLAFSGFWAQIGFVLFSAGRAASAGSTFEQVGWGLLLLFLLYRMWRWGWNSPADTTSHPEILSAPTPTRAANAGHSTLRQVAGWIIRLELLWLTLLAPFFLFPTPGRSIVLLALPLLWIIRRIAHGRFIPRTPLDWAIALMLLMVLVSAFATPDLNFSLGKISGVIFGMAFYYALVEWAAHGRPIPWMLAGAVVAGLGVSVVGLLGAQWVSKLPVLNALTSRFPALIRDLPGAESGIQVNEIGGALLWAIPLQAALLVWLLRTRFANPAKTWLLRLAVAAALAMCALTLILTQSRSSLIGAGAGIGLLLWISLPQLRRVFLVLLVVVVVGGGLVVAQLDHRDLNTFVLGLDSSSGDASVVGRAEIWTRAIYGIQDFPLTGMGMNNFRSAMLSLYPLTTAAGLQGGNLDIGHAHNQFLQAALDLGLPGAVALLAIWITAFMLLFRAWQRVEQALTRVAVAGVAGSLVAYFAYAITDTITLGAKPGVLFWSLLALVVVAWQRSMLSLDQDHHALALESAATNSSS